MNMKRRYHDIAMMMKNKKRIEGMNIPCQMIMPLFQFLKMKITIPLFQLPKHMFPLAYYQSANHCHLVACSISGQ